MNEYSGQILCQAVGLRRYGSLININPSDLLCLLLEENLVED